MGIDYSSMMIVGVRAEEFDEKMCKEDKNFDLWEWMDEHEEFVDCSEYFDAGLEGRIIGIECSNNISEGDLIKFIDEVAPLFEKVRQATGCEPKLIASQNIW